MKIQIFILALCLAACGNDFALDIEGKFLNDAVDVYMLSAPTQGDFANLRSVRWGDPSPDPNVAGICRDFAVKRYGVKYKRSKEIIIRPDPEYPWGVMATVMHEMGHCIHEFEHSPNQDDIMYPEIFSPDENSEAFWKKNLLKKLDEMFSNSRR